MRSAPLGGLLVVDLSRHLPGPFAAKVLCDLGARVVKVEEPELGDPVRRAPPFAEGSSSLAALMLAGVESMALDLKRESARSVLTTLLDRADVLLESFRPGTMARLGLDPTALRKRFPRLVICSLSGFGQNGPDAGRAGHDLTYQAMAGALASTAAMPALPTADLLGAWSAVSAVLAAIVERQRTGQGAWIDASLLDAATHGNLVALAEESAGPRRIGERLMLTGALPCYALYRCADGRLLAIAALERRFWKRFCRLLGRPDLIGLQYATAGDARRKIAALVATRRGEVWERLLAEHDIPGGLVLSMAEALAHPQVRARAVLEERAGRPPRLGFPALVDGRRPRSGSRLPAVGQDTEALLADLGCPEVGWSRRARRRAGIGPRRGLRSWLWRLASRSRS